MSSVIDLIGNTPMIKLNVPSGKPESARFMNVQGDVWVKLEFLNPSGSIKDRIAKYMIEKAEKRGDLKSGCTIVEATSGNAGVSFAMIAALKGYKMVVVMPDTVTEERQQMMKAYGAEVTLTPGDDYVKGAVEKATELSKQPGWYMPAQFDNSDNVTAHMETTAKEILEQVPGGKIDAFVASVGTGGTITGVGNVLRKVNPEVKIFAAQPASSQELSGGKPGRHIMEGIADGFVPKILDKSIIDEIITVRDREAVRFCRLLSAEKGLFCGITSGCNVYAALRVARTSMKKGQNVVTLLPDSADRYLSIGLFSESIDKIKLPPGCAPL